MARPRKHPIRVGPPNPVGRPPIEFKQEYCDLLIQSMREGYTFWSFGGVVGVSRSTLDNWTARYPEFMDAKKVGETALERFYVNMGKLIATGNLRRVKWEKPIMTKVNGKMVPATDAEGNVLYEREYEPVQGNPTAWIFLTKNTIGFRNESHIKLSSGEAPNRSRAAELTPEERMREIAEMTKAIEELNGTPIIETTSRPA